MPNQPKPEMKQPAIVFYVLLATALFVFIQSFSLLSPILLSQQPSNVTPKLKG